MREWKGEVKCFRWTLFPLGRVEECEAVDCDAGGLMLFQGTDHIHFREKLEADYYNILLLHYCSV